MAALRLAGVELGGTKVIAVLVEDSNVIDEATLPTTDPATTLGALHVQLLKWDAARRLDALGISSFGPIRLDMAHPGFGTMLKTPKPGWTGAPIGSLADGLNCPWAIDTDVNGAALAEYLHGGGQGCDVVCYITIGTGVGGGLTIGGRPLHGALHPEIGHLMLRRSSGDMFIGNCPFHGDCVEGLISGPALTERFGMDATAILDADARWQDVASDLAELCSALLLTTSANRILFGGSVAVKRDFLLPMVHALLVDRVSSYLPFVTTESVAGIVRLAALGTCAGPFGAIALAERAYSDLS